MEDDFQSYVCIPGAVLVVVFSVTALVLNGLLLIVLWKDPTKSSRSTTTVYIASLSVLQASYAVIVGTAATVSYIACAVGDEESPHLGKEFSRLCLTFLLRVEIFLVIAFAVERLGNTSFPASYQRGSYKAKNALFCAGCIVLYSLCFSILDMIAGKFWVRRLDVHINNIIPLVVIVVLASLLCNSLRKPSIRQRGGYDAVLRQTTENIQANRLKKQKPLATSFVSIAFLFVAAVMIFFFFSLYEVYCSDCWKHEWFFAVMRISIAISFVHAAASPLIYYACLPKLRKGFKMIFCGKREQEQIPLGRLNRNATRTVPVIYL